MSQQRKKSDFGFTGIIIYTENTWFEKLSKENNQAKEMEPRHWENPTTSSTPCICGPNKIPALSAILLHSLLLHHENGGQGRAGRHYFVLHNLCFCGLVPWMRVTQLKQTLTDSLKRQTGFLYPLTALIKKMETHIEKQEEHISDYSRGRSFFQDEGL